MTALATDDDVEALWRPLSEAESARIGRLLDVASAKVRQAVPTVDARVASGDLDADIVVSVVVSMVARVLTNPGMVRQITVGGESVTLAAETLRGLFLLPEELAELSPSAGRRVGPIMSYPGLEYPCR